MRRLLQVFALLLVILAGSLPGLSLPAPAEPCRCGMPVDACPMKMPVRSSGSAPGGLVAPVSLVTAACRLAQAPARDARREASPFPLAAGTGAARLLASGPALLARPGPHPPLLTPARLSVFRI